MNARSRSRSSAPATNWSVTRPSVPADLEGSDAQPAAGPSEPGVGAGDVCSIADYLVLLLLTGDAMSVRVDPQATDLHRITLLDASGARGSFLLGDGLGDAIVARFALMAGLDLLKPTSQAGTTRVGFEMVTDDVVVAMRPTEHGLAGELRLLEAAFQPVAVADELIKPGAHIGPYVVSSKLGRGGMGIVYAAEHPILRRKVAIKVLLSEVLESDPGSARRFVREAQAAARIDHPGIVEVSDFGTLPDGRPYLVMERLGGRTLAQLIEADGALEPHRAIALALGIADALSAAHKAGVLHRDLTPRNVFVLDEGGAERVVLVDFGAATTNDPEHAAVPDGPPGMVIGTPRYMPPEVARGFEADARTDIYALGVILFELLTGRVPYDGSDADVIVQQHISGPIPAVESPRGPLPDELVALVRRALAKLPAERFASVASLVGDLERIEQKVVRSGWRMFLPL